MQDIEEQKVKLEQKKHRLVLEETRLRLKEQKMRTRHLIEIGGLVVKAGLDHLPANTLYGALISLNDELKNQQIATSTNDLDAESKSSFTFQITNQLLKEAYDRHLLYIIILNQSNEQFNSMNFIILNKWRHSEMNNKKNLGIKGKI